MFIQIHTLTSYHASLLNRDDAGLAKRINFGNGIRLRISSQCLKRHWTERFRDILDLPYGIRTRHFFSREILRRLVEEHGIASDIAEKMVIGLIGALIKKKGSAAEKKENNEESLALKQPILFGKPEADFFVSFLKECWDEGGEKQVSKLLDDRFKANKRNFAAMLRQAGYDNLYAGLEGALFGRFVTSDILARTDAPIHVAHALTVHALDTEVDYFTVVDDLNLQEETGAAHAGDTELGAGVYYGYVVVDVPLLISNLTGANSKEWKKQDSRNAHSIIKALVKTIATVSPGAKLGSTAPYAYSDFVLVEAGSQQPRSLANAYLEALPARGDVMQRAVDTLGSHLLSLEKMYGITSDMRAVATTKGFDNAIASTVTLDAATDRILDTIFSGR
jgi:CRISPR system Cascade subunit CasC